MKEGSLFGVTLSRTSMPGLNMGGLCFSCRGGSHGRQLQQSRAEGAAPAFLSLCLPNWGLSSPGRWEWREGSQSKSQRSGSQSEFRKLAWEAVEQGARLVKDLLISAAHWRPLFRWAGSSVGLPGASSSGAWEMLELQTSCSCATGWDPCSDLLTLHYPVVTWVHSHLSDFCRDCTSDSSFQSAYCTWKPL